MKQALFAILLMGSLFGTDGALEEQLRYEALDCEIARDYLVAAHGGDASYDKAVWIYNGLIYQQNEEGQWVQIGRKEGKSFCFDFEDAHAGGEG